MEPKRKRKKLKLPFGRLRVPFFGYSRQYLPVTEHWFVSERNNKTLHLQKQNINDMNSIKISDKALMNAAKNGNWAFLEVFIDAYKKATGDELTAESMAKLNGWQNVLLAFSVFRDEVRSGGFVQLIYNGYGPYIFENPFAKAMKEMGAKELSKLVYKAREIYELRKDDLAKEVEEDELCETYLDYEEFDPLDDEYIELEADSISAIAHYVDEHIDDFGEVVKD